MNIYLALWLGFFASAPLVADPRKPLTYEVVKRAYANARPSSVDQFRTLLRGRSRDERLYIGEAFLPETEEGQISCVLGILYPGNTLSALVPIFEPEKDFFIHFIRPDKAVIQTQVAMKAGTQSNTYADDAGERTLVVLQSQNGKPFLKHSIKMLEVKTGNGNLPQSRYFTPNEGNPPGPFVFLVKTLCTAESGKCEIKYREVERNQKTILDDGPMYSLLGINMETLGHYLTEQLIHSQ